MPPVSFPLSEQPPTSHLRRARSHICAYEGKVTATWTKKKNAVTQELVKMPRTVGTHPRKPAYLPAFCWTDHWGGNGVVVQVATTCIGESLGGTVLVHDMFPLKRQLKVREHRWTAAGRLGIRRRVGSTSTLSPVERDESRSITYTGLHFGCRTNTPSPWQTRKAESSVVAGATPR
ncbi:hypothetical protein LZ32DRAFT_460506 [Colletotrichum eremochloae]|nr:hypothetical protein LZ32DRAFT_460506 [Colletotrichum eremochloae]